MLYLQSFQFHRHSIYLWIISYGCIFSIKLSSHFLKGNFSSWKCIMDNYVLVNFRNSEFHIWPERTSYTAELLVILLLCFFKLISIYSALLSFLSKVNGLQKPNKYFTERLSQSSIQYIQTNLSFCHILLFCMANMKQACIQWCYQFIQQMEGRNHDFSLCN